jgi:hypothetical protein
MQRMRILVNLGVVVAIASGADAQSLGTFRWQLQPYCNVVTLSVTQVGGIYRVEGTDDRCGAAQAASAIGTAFLNPDGAIGLGLNIVAAPGGQPQPVSATLALATLNGTWRDEAGHVGSLAFTPGAGTGGSPRPLPSLPVIPTTIRLYNDGAFAAIADGDGVIPASGPGARMMWYAKKRAFRAGRVSGSQWDDINTGEFSTAFGVSTRASGAGSTAFGLSTTASGDNSTALGVFTTASGGAATAMGESTMAIGPRSTALGLETQAGGSQSLAAGVATAATGSNAAAFGDRSVASGNQSLAAGVFSHAAGAESVALGFQVTAGANGSVVLGSNARTQASAVGTILFADRSQGTVPYVAAAANEFGVRASGGIYLYTSPNLTSGVTLAPNGSSWASLSDANAKENFRDVDGEVLLGKLAAMPVREWSYKAQDAAIRHMGPTAQDFRAAFGLGDFPLRINTIDADGVALAGVKALEARTRALSEENAALRAALEDLRREWQAAIEALRNALAQK